MGSGRDERRTALTFLAHSIHNLGLVGHIEDIAVRKDQQGKKLGLSLIQALDYVAEKVGCYKVCPLIPNPGFVMMAAVIFGKSG